MSTGSKIRRLRKERGLTLKELGDILGVTKSTIQKYENGSIVNFKTDTITRLSALFDVHPAYLLEWDDKYDIEKLIEEIKYIEEAQDVFRSEISLIINNVTKDGLYKILDYAECVANLDEYKISK